MVVWDYDDRPVYGECKGAATELNGRTGVITDLVADEDGPEVRACVRRGAGGVSARSAALRRFGSAPKVIDRDILDAIPLKNGERE